MIMSGLIPSFEKAPIADPIQFCAVTGVPGVDGDIASPAVDDANPGVADANPGVADNSGADDEPARVVGAPEVPTASVGTAASSESMPGTVWATFAKSSGLSNAFAMPKSTPAAPAACSGVDPSSLANPLTSSGLALAALESASACDGAAPSTCARAGVADANNGT